VLEHGKLWEFLLIEELLRSKLQALKSECDQFDELLTSAPRKRFSGPEFMNWLSSEMDELVHRFHETYHMSEILFGIDAV
jgi:hypothetical protein